MRMLKQFSTVLALIITLAVMGCSSAATPSPQEQALPGTPQPIPTATAVPTQTPIPTPIPVPTSTKEPTATPIPRATSQATETPVPLATHSPTAVPTLTQVPMVTGTSEPVPNLEPPPTASPTPVPEPTVAPAASPSPSPTPESVGSAQVEIISIFFDGEEPRYEGDEYVEIKNVGTAPQQMEGWILKDVENESLEFVFTAYILEPGGVIRVYTDEIHPEWGGFSFEHGTAIWNNSTPDTAELRDAEGKQVSTASY